MTMHQVDLNADVGEQCGDDAALFMLISSANIACGWHAGDADVMRATIRLARDRGIAAGAHPSYPDRPNFGRVVMNRSADEVYDDVVAQIRALEAIAASEGVELAHVKAHGALYNVAARDASIADAISRAVADVVPHAGLYGLAGGEQIGSARRHGLRPIAEGFADRRYRQDGSLVPRTQPDAIIADEKEAVAQALMLASSGRAQTICLHGDTPHALLFARRIRAAFEESGITIAAP